MLAQTVKIFVLSTALGLSSVQVFADTARTGSVQQVKLNAQQDIKNLIEPQLLRYCGQSCELIQIDVDVREDVDENTELGFEAIVGDAARPRLIIERATANIQVDDNITSQNRDRLKTILMNHMRGSALNADVIWRPVQMPNIGLNSASSASLQKQLETQIEQAVSKTLQTYCPDQCLLAFVGVKGQLINNDEADNLPRNQIVRDPSGKSVMRIDAVNVEVAMDESLEEASRERITNILRANTKFATPVAINVSMSQFPETQASRSRRENSDDPYGLEKLRQMLIMFRDLAGTKEIITNSSLNTETKSSEKNSASTNATNNSTENSMSKSATLDSKSSIDMANKEQDWILWGSLGLVAVLIAFVFMKYVGAQRDAKVMLANMESAAAGGASSRRPERYDEQGRPIFASENATVQAVNPQEIANKLKREKLRDELSRGFMNEPKVARETFSRMLKEDGVELTSQYLHIFGHMIILELIDDPNMARDLYALSEFFHKTNISISADEEMALLQNLKARQTASEIRVLTSKGSDKFAFLEKLDPAQIFTLISEEKAQVQSIVLTQLDKKRRMAVFDMYQGPSKVQLMNELCRADAIPKEYLNNVARALHKKVDSRPEFDTENIRSSEIIIDLLERSSLDEQRQIMSHLQRHHADTARGIMMKLVTLEFLNYLKDGHLIEIFLGMDREDLLTFLAGTEENYRNMIMSKAPYELVESWLEELNNVSGADETAYKLVELKICNKIRNLGNTGVLSVLDINEMIYSPDLNVDSRNQVGKMSSNAMVA